MAGEPTTAVVQHYLNDLARRLDHQPAAVELRDGFHPVEPGSDSTICPDLCRMLEGIDVLPTEERVAIDLVRVQGMTPTEAADVLGVATRMVKRRLGDLRQTRAEPAPQLGR